MDWLHNAMTSRSIPATYPAKEASVRNKVLEASVTLPPPQDGRLRPQYLTEDQMHRAIDIVFDEALKLSAGNHDAADYLLARVSDAFFNSTRSFSAEKFDSHLVTLTRRTRQQESRAARIVQLSRAQLGMAA